MPPTHFISNFYHQYTSSWTHLVLFNRVYNQNNFLQHGQGNLWPLTTHRKLRALTSSQVVCKQLWFKDRESHWTPIKPTLLEDVILQVNKQIRGWRIKKVTILVKTPTLYSSFLQIFEATDPNSADSNYFWLKCDFELLPTTPAAWDCFWNTSSHTNNKPWKCCTMHKRVPLCLVLEWKWQPDTSCKRSGFLLRLPRLSIKTDSTGYAVSFIRKI